MKPQILIAHSLGSIVAYEALWAHPDCSVDMFLTLGSPLAMPDVVYDRLAEHAGPRGRPPGVRRWINIADHGDIIAIPRGGVSHAFVGLTGDISDNIHAFDFHRVTRLPSLSCHHGCSCGNDMTMTGPSDPRLAHSTAAPFPSRAAAGTAVCIGLSSFQGSIAPEQEPPADAWRDLRYAGPVTKDLAAALADLGFACSVYAENDLPTAQELGSCISESLAASTSSGAHIVHVLSHGHPGKSGVYVVGADGRWAQSTRVESWVASIEDDPGQQRPHTLFLIDTCYSGQAARLDWLRAATERTRAWVIAASEPDAPAFNGRLTRAVTTVLKKLRSGELDFSPSTYVPFVHLVDHVRREVVRLGGESQYVTGTPVDGLFEPPLLVNPRHAPPGSSRVALAEVDPLASPFGDLDTALDPAHFLDRAAGHRGGDVTEAVGFFTGRTDQIQQLTTSLDRDAPNWPDGHHRRGGFRQVCALGRHGLCPAPPPARTYSAPLAASPCSRIRVDGSAGGDPPS